MLTRKERIASAQLTGIAAAYAQIRRLDAAAARAEMAAVLAEFDVAARARILADAASAYADGELYFAAGAFELLVSAGADPAEAHRMRAGRTRSNPMRVVSDQANRRRTGDT